MSAEIVGTGMYVNGDPIPNSVFNERYKMDVDKFLREKRNIYTRHYMRDDQATSDLVVEAAKRAMDKAGITAADLDLIIVSTDTPDYVSPSTASVVQHKLRATKAGTFDVNTACAGFVTGLDIGWKYIKADTQNQYRYILVAGAYGMSKWLNPDDYKIATLFADGAGAVILKASDSKTSDILASQLYTDGQYHDYMGVYAGGTHMPITADVVARKDHLLNFAKKIPIETNGTHWPRLVHTLLDRTHNKVSDIKKFFLTQINIDSINETMDKLEVDRKMSHNIMDRFGYTGSAAIPMAIADADSKGLLKKGDLIMLVGSGGGLSMAAMALRW